MPKFDSCPRKHKINLHKLVLANQIEVAWDSRRVEDIRSQYIHHFVWTLVNEKAVFKVCSVCSQLIKNKFRAFFVTVSTQKKKEFLHKYVTAGKVLASVFWNVQGIWFINYFKKGRTINNKYYIELLVCLKERNCQKTVTNKEKSALSQRTVS